MSDLIASALRRKLAAAEAAGDKELVKRLRGRMGEVEGSAPAPVVPVEDYEAWTVDDLRAEAGDLTVKRGDGEDGQPLKADYVKALKSRDKKAAK